MADSNPTASKPAAAKPGPKPKPRAGVQRKTKAEREQFAKEEAERQKARAAEEAAKNAATRGGRGAGRGGRGGRGASTSGRDERRDHSFGGGGVFGAGSAARPTARRALGEGYAELLEGQQAAKPDEFGGTPGAIEIEGDMPSSSGGGRTAGAKKNEIYDLDESDDEPKELMRDMDAIAISSSDEAEPEPEEEPNDSKGKEKETKLAHRPKRVRGLRPSRAARYLTEAEQKEKEEKAAKLGKKPRTVKKVEPDAQDVADDGDAMDLDEPVFVKEQPSSPELGRRRSLKKVRSRDAKPGSAVETIEEAAERERVTLDMNKLRELILRSQTHEHPATVSDGIPSDEEFEDRATRDGKLLLFQLPPLTPFLFDASIPDESEVKTEPGVDNTAATKEEADGGAQPGRPRLQTDKLLTATEPQPLPAGMVGKLRVHKSGKVSMDWGGTDMEVRYGAEVDYLQDVVLVQPPIKKEDDEDVEMKDGNNETNDGEEKKSKPKPKGTAFALGQIRKKMVLIPDWAKLYD
ncbi:hypothetical protein LTR10_023781 [Elasticomyces elasticus]|uniref:DNA-directed RNA polymerase III subunit RPC4 n=1 Tax=Exophiala sideris TaxID=1016849 RepID=A0ABR0JIA8_9EURO|nr:hypothetical protein LTR10_023781 [Elasticomyces elasticus]KAK5034199.1 hypothetical protein LTS07_003119 [Exophiala sideris]KAK5042495.1 hypothetical protein LTR13_001342 [Exophiala sideris]KAK5065577.1 hypothetical protein LTR69_003126 [Exophiala sideris]KAK5185965.1 hypothetical protein LTR44_002014 [Eurotiomycetes sp. CCFEE 6388]